MPSPKQLAANRHNAQKSTGPTTTTGKAAVAHNAMKHGLLSQHVCLPDEEEAALIALGKQLRHALQPVGEFELVLVDRIVTSLWRLRRVVAIETSLWREHLEDPLRPHATLGKAFVWDHGDRLGRLLRHETTFERSLYKALHELERRQAARHGEVVPPPAVGELDVALSLNGQEREPAL